MAAMNNSPLEFLARQYDNVVKYDAQGNPSIFVKFPKMKSKDLDSSLPDHTHPAFIVNGVEQDYILLGKYKAASLTGSGSDGGTLYSLPNMPPAHSCNADQFLSQLRAFGGGVSGMTVADRGFLLLLAQKNGGFLFSGVPARSSVFGFIHYAMREFFTLSVSLVRGYI